MKKQQWNIISNYVKPAIVYKGRKLGFYFQIKGKTQVEHYYDVINHSEYPKAIYQEETARRKNYWALISYI